MSVEGLCKGLGSQYREMGSTAVREYPSKAQWAEPSASDPPLELPPPARGVFALTKPATPHPIAQMGSGGGRNNNNNKNNRKVLS
jgi:hypothetical protein